MSRNRTMLVAGVAVGLLAVGALLFVNARGSGAATAGGDPLQTVTPYQLSVMGVTLGAPDAQSPSITASQADATAQGFGPFYGDPVLETVYAACKEPTGMVDCWIVSLKPTRPVGGPGRIGPPPTSDPTPADDPATVELVWVNPQTGAIMDAMDTQAPASPSTSG